jgi:hypothetical protein
MAGGRTTGQYLTVVTREVTAHQILCKGTGMLCNGARIVAGIGSRLDFLPH